MTKPAKSIPYQSQLTDQSVLLSSSYGQSTGYIEFFKSTQFLTTDIGDTSPECAVLLHVSTPFFS